MAFRVGGRGGGRRRGIPVANVEVLEAMQQMQARLEAMEMGREVRCYRCNKLGRRTYECKNIGIN